MTFGGARLRDDEARAQDKASPMVERRQADGKSNHRHANLREIKRVTASHQIA
ncbi:hypothetical protein EDC35_10740 [Thiobaca trueperi]|uniref:Uncharacterized protein n=1 Tax=Thiobaca trueperi TaxID=127458 RepID=A0A4V2V138_9GAMM|nr:hypothetical protein EDC35_10740 [Thiobaca trueperi]